MPEKAKAGTPPAKATLILSPLAWEAMVAHARTTAPEEACGILVGILAGGRREVIRAVACRNAHAGDRRKHFLIDPEQHLAAQREAREAGLEIVGFYHSHHNGSAAMSDEDRQQAHPFVSNVILAFRDGVLTEARPWRIDQDGMPAEEKLLIEPVTSGRPPASEKADEA